MSLLSSKEIPYPERITQVASCDVTHPSASGLTVAIGKKVNRSLKRNDQDGVVSVLLVRLGCVAPLVDCLLLAVVMASTWTNFALMEDWTCVLLPEYPLMQ